MGNTIASPPPRAPWIVALVVVGAIGMGGFEVYSRTDGEAPPRTSGLDATLTGTVDASEEDLGPIASPSAAPSPVWEAVDAVRAGESAYNTGDFAAALALYEAAVTANPDDAVALNNVGQVLVRLDRAGQAIPYFDRAVARAPETWAYHFNRARAYAALHQWQAAVKGYREAAALFPDDYATAFNLATALQAGGDLAGAIEQFARAVALAPAEPQLYLAHARALEAGGRRHDAVAAYRQYLELAPGSPDAEAVSTRLAALSAVQ